MSDFVIVGERRSGTTSLYHWLKRHPDIYLLDTSDKNFFIEEEIVQAREWREGSADASAWERDHSLEEYEALFQQGNGYVVTGHKGADLLFWHEAHPRMRRYLPNGRFIAVLRNPVDRAWSHYWNEVGKGRETLSFEEAIAAEAERIQVSDYARDHLSYVARGFYAKSLRRFFNHIERERILILILEKLRRNPDAAMQEVCTFLGVDPSRMGTIKGDKYNANWTTEPRFPNAPGPVKKLEALWLRLTAGVVRRLTRNAERRRKWRNSANRIFRKPVSGRPIPPSIKQKLRDIYTPANRELAEMLGIELKEWDT